MIKHDQEELKNFDFEKNLSDYENGVGKIVVKSRLRKNLDYWKSIDASPYMLDIISSGYKIPFIEEPPCAKSENNKSTLDNSEFVNEALVGLVETDRVLEVPFLLKVISPLSVSTKNNKKRLILDLRYVNKFIWKEKIKFDWSVFQNYLCPKGYIFKFNLCSGYHQIDIFPAHQLFLGFSWEVKGVTKYFCFTVLLFGISPAPYAFIKVCRTLVKLWRSNGVKIAMFIDDGNGIAEEVRFRRQ